MDGKPECPMRACSSMALRATDQVSAVSLPSNNFHPGILEAFAPICLLTCSGMRLSPHSDIALGRHGKLG